MLENIGIILTVPHALCIYDNKNHTCDATAKKLAYKLMSKLGGKITNNITTVIGNINRSKIDLNRIQSRKTEFRKIIVKIIKTWEKKKLKVIFVIDCHSFPIKKFRIYDFGTNQISKPLVTILYDSLVHHEYIDYLDQLPITKLKGIHNDIIDQSITFEDKNTKIMPVLIEVREDMTDKQYTILSTVIENWIKGIAK